MDNQRDSTINRTSSTRWMLDATGGMIAGMSGIIVGHPFDTIKVRQQTNAKTYGSVLQSVKVTFLNEGYRGFFKGMLFPLLSAGTQNSILFSSYELTLRHIKSALPSSQSDPKKATYGQIALASGIAGIVQAIPASPIELVKVQLQTNAGNMLHTSDGQLLQTTEMKSLRPSGQFQGPFQCIKYIFREHGTRGVFKGLQIMIIREIPSISTFITSNEYLRDVMHVNEQQDEHVTFHKELLAGGIAGVLSWAINIPIDVIKSNLQADNLAAPKYRGIIHCAQEVMLKEGPKGFFRGLPVICTRGFIVNAVTLTVYGRCKTFIESISTD